MVSTRGLDKQAMQALRHESSGKIPVLTSSNPQGLYMPAAFRKEGNAVVRRTLRMYMTKTAEQVMLVFKWPPDGLRRRQVAVSRAIVSSALRLVIRGELVREQ